MMPRVARLSDSCTYASDRGGFFFQFGLKLKPIKTSTTRKLVQGEYACRRSASEASEVGSEAPFEVSEVCSEASEVCS